MRRAVSATAPLPALKRSSKHHDRSRIPRLCRPGLQPHPARPRVVRRPRYAAVALRQARERAVHVPAGVGRRRRAVRALLVHRAAGEDPHPRARHRDRGRRRRRHRRAARRRPARVRRRVPAPLPRGAATRSAAVLRRARRLFRLRHGAPHRDEARRPGAAAGTRPRRRARHPAAAHRGARRRRQPRRQDLADRLRRSGRIPTPTRRRGNGCRRCAASCASPCRSRSRPRPPSRRRKASSAPRASSARCGAPRTTSPPAT